MQVDLSLEVILEIFSSRGLHELFQQVAAREIRLSGNARRIFALQEEYERTIDAVMAFLQGRNRTLAYSRFANPISCPGQVVSSKRKIRNGPSG